MYSDIAPDGKNEILAALENDGLADALPQALSEDEANALIAESKTNSGAALQIETVKRLAATQAANPPLFGRIYAALPNKVWLRKALSDLKRQPLGNSRFDMSAEGLRHYSPKTEMRSLIAGPFEVEGLCRDTASCGWGLGLKWIDGDGVGHRVRLSQGDLQGDPAAVCARLADAGLWIKRSSQGELIEYLSDVCSTCDRRIRLVRSTGWHVLSDRRVFVLPDETFGADDRESVILDAASATSPYDARGSLEDWRNGVGALVHGNVLPTFMLSAAFAGPLLEPLGVESGGFNLMGASSSGKTSLLLCCGSVWGKGSIGGFVRTWRSTSNALEGVAAATSDTLLCLDELGVADPREIATAVYSLASGVEKTRLRRDATLRQGKTWRGVILSSSEVTLADKIAEAGGKARAGQAMRLVDLSADRGLGHGVFDHIEGYDDGARLADALKAAAQQNHGTAGPEFLRRLVKYSGDELAGAWRVFEADFRASAGSSGACGQVLRAVTRFALVGFAGELASCFEVTGWETNHALHGSARQAALTAFRTWLEGRGGAGSFEERQAVAQVRLFIEQFGESRFERLDGPSIANTLAPRAIIHRRAGWTKGQGNNQEWCVLPEVWRQEICKGLDPVFVARTLAARGMLRRGEGNKFQSNVWTGERTARAYVLIAKILDDGGA